MSSVVDASTHDAPEDSALQEDQPVTSPDTTHDDLDLLEQGRQQIRSLLEMMPKDKWSNLFSRKLVRRDGQVVYKDGNNHPEIIPEVYWFNDINDAIAKYEEWVRDVDRNVYMSKGYFNEPLGTNKRGSLNDMAGVLCLSLDVDYGEEHNNSKHYPPTLDDTSAVVHTIILQPTLLIHTGHGLAPLWKLDQPITDIAQAQNIAKRLYQLYEEEMEAQGWDIDPAYDSARPIRIAGSQNFNRPKNPVPVTIFEHNDEHTVNAHCLDTNLPQLKEECREVSATIVSIGELKLDPEAQPNSELYRKLSEKEDFMRSWKYEREEFKGDNSPSRYDFSIACFVIQNGGTAQDCADFMIASRKRNGVDLKLDRPDYYERTISKAVQLKDDPEVHNHIDRHAREICGEFDVKELVVKHRRGENLTETERDAVLQSINADLYLNFLARPITRISQAEVYDDGKGSIAVYTFEFGEYGSVVFNGYPELKKYKMLSKISEKLSRRVSVEDRFYWSGLIDRVFAAAVQETIEPDCTPLGAVRLQLKDFLIRERLYDDYELSRKRQSPCLDGNYIWFYPKKLLEQLNLSGTGRNTYYKKLRDIGCDKASKRWIGGVDTTWRIEWRLIMEESELRDALQFDEPLESPETPQPEDKDIELPTGYNINNWNPAA